VLSSASLFIGVTLLWLSSRVNIVLFASGSSHLLILVLIGPPLFPYYYGIYIFSLLIISLIGTPLFSPVIAFLGLGGLPPLSMFWAKFLVITVSPLATSSLVLLVSLLLLWPYLRCSLSFASSSTTSLPALLSSVCLPLYAVMLCF